MINIIYLIVSGLIIGGLIIGYDKISSRDIITKKSLFQNIFIGAISVAIIFVGLVINQVIIYNNQTHDRMPIPVTTVKKVLSDVDDKHYDVNNINDDRHIIMDDVNISGYYFCDRFYTTHIPSIDLLFYNITDIIGVVFGALLGTCFWISVYGIFIKRLKL